ncbi:glucuronate isomerase [Jeotgalibaca sp. MA1X17-3]|uniref:glucuronate isomerase n=1 Tax=Jeotgalibaca sp. MA1X17-3 TaxID=2908211 RepID=UPI001F3CBC12|nr:glucuronate isomerase [Jeotgalibaca sp. MA1X17-3]UJF15663.1 glucuronate isomerase [Jeotgalibaca sp. MA1X17-3]
MGFINADFMLNNETGKHLYHRYAEKMPIFDYHCHLIPEWIAKDHEFKDITELWLSGDHYKWRAMRANGVPERKITGDASSEEKFEAWAETAENTIGNPLFHWTQLELKRYFDIDDLLSKDNWKEIYDKANQILKDKKLTARKLIEMSNVTFIGTTDNPTDSLEYHDQISKDDSFHVKVAPSFRPDEAFHIDDERFVGFLDRMETIFGTRLTSYRQLKEQLQQRVNYFDERGTLASDHALENMVYQEATKEEIETIFQKALNQETITKKEKEQYLTRILVDLGEMYEEKGWAMQIHFGALRNNNEYWYNKLGPDVGFDSLHDSVEDGRHLNQLLNAMAKNKKLPKMIIYNLNPTQNHIVASAVANFQVNDEGIKNKVQFGAGWWFNDTEQGMLRQMETLADHGLLMNFVGMLTDSRSFVSYPRHEYFRRILCNYIGEQVELGKFPQNEELLKKLVENVCYNNAVSYFKK